MNCPTCNGVLIRGEDGPVCLLCGRTLTIPRIATKTDKQESWAFKQSAKQTKRRGMHE